MWQDFQHHRAAALRLDALRQHPPDLLRGAHAERRDRELRPDHLREGRLGGAHDRALPRRRRPSGRACAPTSAGTASRTRSPPICGARSPKPSGEPVEPIVRAWIEQEGLPGAVAAARARAGPHACSRCGRSASRQTPRAKRARRRASRLRWPIPWVGRVADARGRARIVRKLADGRDDAHRPRSRRDRASSTATPTRAASSARCTTPADAARARRATCRCSPPSSAWGSSTTSGRWCARAARAIDGFLDLASALRRRARARRAAGAARPLALPRRPPRRRGRPRARRSASATGSRRASAPRFLELGWEPKPRRGRRRAAAARGAGRACSARSPSGRPCWRPARGSASSATSRDRDAIDPNLADPVVPLAARGGDAARFESMLAAFEQRARRRRSAAASCSRSASSARRSSSIARSRCASPIACRPRTWRSCWCDCSPTAAARERTWAFVQKRWSRLRRRMPPMLASRLVETRRRCSGRSDAARSPRSSARTRCPTGGRALRPGARALRPRRRLLQARRAGSRAWLADRLTRRYELTPANNARTRTVSRHGSATNPPNRFERLTTTSRRRGAGRRRAPDPKVVYYRDPARRIIATNECRPGLRGQRQSVSRLRARLRLLPGAARSCPLQTSVR